jgi:hypothetical protein
VLMNFSSPRQRKSPACSQELLVFTKHAVEFTVAPDKQ